MQSQQGFTLIELLITLTVVAVIMSIAVPSFRTMLLNSQLTAQRDGLGNALRYARSTALSQNVNTEVCPFSAVNSTACGSNWAAGWIVVLNPSGIPATPATALLQSTQVSPNGPTVYNVNNPALVAVTFNPRGLSANLPQFVVCDSRGSSFAYSVDVQTTGSVEVGTTPGAAVWSGNIVCP